MATIDLDTKGRILSTAMDMIGREGHLNITTREIAEKANVNVAAINYHFGSKDNLIAKIEERFVADIKDIYAILHDESLEPKERLWIWADRLMVHLLDHPGILFMWASSIIGSDMKNEGIAKLIEYSEESLTVIVEEAIGHIDDMQISFKVMQLISTIISPILLYESGSRSMSTNIRDDAIRGQYIDAIVESIL